MTRAVAVVRCTVAVRDEVPPPLHERPLEETVGDGGGQDGRDQGSGQDDGKVVGEGVLSWTGRLTPITLVTSASIVAALLVGTGLARRSSP